MRWLRLGVRVFGWLLTPLLAWAACFLGAVGGALLAMHIREPRTGLAVTVFIGAAAGVAVILLWLRLLRRSPQVRDALAVQSDGTPDIIAGTDPDEPHATSSTPRPEPTSRSEPTARSEPTSRKEAPHPAR
ncbi:MAG TPA: hypothetical protein VFS33_06115 [Gemmatimonadales bacterium]|jgi:hypothetical protein|nr:hypothetical protein [Gemmatimonadales bacterium]